MFSHLHLDLLVVFFLRGFLLELLPHFSPMRATWREGVDWVHLTQDRVKWPAVVSKVMNLGVT
jgi:hypothetical protein